MVLYVRTAERLCFVQAETDRRGEMGWSKLDDEKGYIGDAGWDILDGAVDKFVAVYQTQFGRNPTAYELMASLMFVCPDEKIDLSAYECGHLTVESAIAALRKVRGHLFTMYNLLDVAGEHIHAWERTYALECVESGRKIIEDALKDSLWKQKE